MGHKLVNITEHDPTFICKCNIIQKRFALGVKGSDLHYLLISSSLTFLVLSGDVDLLKEECRMLREECQTLKEDNRRLTERLQLLQRQRTW